MKVLRTIKKTIIKLLSFFYLKYLRKGITKNDFSIISNDCCGGVIYHRIGKKFCSPFINLFIHHDDFIELLSNLNDYLNEDLIEKPSQSDYPIGTLGKRRTIEIHFLHYANFTHAKECWERRKKRLIKEKMIVIFNLTNSLDKQYVEKYTKKIEKTGIANYLVLSRFASNNPNNIKIDFSDLKEFHNAQVLAPERVPYKLHIDQINYKKVFSVFR